MQMYGLGTNLIDTNAHLLCFVFLYFNVIHVHVQIDDLVLYSYSK